MKLSIVKDFLSFLRKPDYKSYNLNFSQKLIILLKLYLITLVMLFLSRLLIELFIVLGAFEEYTQKISKLPEIANKENSYIYIAIAMVLGPIFEEIVFRLSLTKYNKRFIVISTSLLIGYLLTRSLSAYLLNIKSAYIYSLMSYVYPICFALPFFMIGNKIKFDFELTWNKFYSIIFYSTAIVFALTHIPTLSISKDHYLFLPIMILPFIVLGTSLGYTRTRLGVLYAITFHFLINTPMVIKIIIGISKNSQY